MLNKAISLNGGYETCLFTGKIAICKMFRRGRGEALMITFLNFPSNYQLYLIRCLYNYQAFAMVAPSLDESQASPIGASSLAPPLIDCVQLDGLGSSTELFAGKHAHNSTLHWFMDVCMHNFSVAGLVGLFLQFLLPCIFGI